MARGLTEAAANAQLNAELRGVSYTGNAACWVKLYLGDPGPTGAANAAATTTRKQATFSVPSGGSTSATVSWTGWVTPETISDIGLFDAETSGTFFRSAQLSVAKAMTANDSLSLTITVSKTPLAA